MKNRFEASQTTHHVFNECHTAHFQPWERDPFVCVDTDSTWTAALVTGDGAEELYDMCVVGEPGHDGPASWDVTGIRDGEVTTFGSGESASFAAACRSAEIAARRASMRVVEAGPRDRH